MINTFVCHPVILYHVKKDLSRLCSLSLQGSLENHVKSSEGLQTIVLALQFGPGPGY